jgi:hypothetical protein
MITQMENKFTVAIFVNHIAALTLTNQLLPPCRLSSEMRCRRTFSLFSEVLEEGPRISSVPHISLGPKAINQSDPIPDIVYKK